MYKVKKERFEQTKADYITEKQRLDADISQLRNALNTGSTTQYEDARTGQVVTRANNANRKTFEAQLNTAMTNKETVDNKIVAANDSITALDMKILEIESKAELAGELGPLKYLSNLTGKPMDQIINWFLLVIIFVFDPLAICLVIAANIAFNQLKPKPQSEESPKEYQMYTPPVVVEEPKPELYIHPSAPLIQKIKKRDDDDTIIKYT